MRATSSLGYVLNRSKSITRPLSGVLLRVMMWSMIPQLSAPLYVDVHDEDGEHVQVYIG
jgi:hypothetical protein